MPAYVEEGVDPVSQETRERLMAEAGFRARYESFGQSLEAFDAQQD